jgi:hypothetical protein
MSVIVTPVKSTCLVQSVVWKIMNRWDYKCTEKSHIFWNCKSGWHKTWVLLFWIPVRRNRKARLPDWHVAYSTDTYRVLQCWYMRFFCFGVLWIKILKKLWLFPKFVMLNLLALSHLCGTGQAERTVLWYTILWDLYESVSYIDTLKIKCSPQAHFCSYPGLYFLEVMPSSVSILLGSSTYIVELGCLISLWEAVKSKGAQIFKKCRTCLQMLCARRVTFSKFHIEDPQVLGAQDLGTPG